MIALLSIHQPWPNKSIHQPKGDLLNDKCEVDPRSTSLAGPTWTRTTHVGAVPLSSYAASGSASSSLSFSRRSRPWQWQSAELHLHVRYSQARLSQPQLDAGPHGLQRRRLSRPLLDGVLLSPSYAACTAFPSSSTSPPRVTESPARSRPSPPEASRVWTTSNASVTDTTSAPPSAATLN
ncbi:hypothetical protein SAY87_030876 [Trapa incisa]|uniref:Uncharacterized protein n=1 Tax=Trapa incisa TaxID=236973 RepID=A0AAN7QKH3_9MYRT|nr:hypothetical protein SAY87_030876 [Trapa incisa]